MSGSSLDGLDLAYVEFTETDNKWSYHIIAQQCFSYDDDLEGKLYFAHSVEALEYIQTHRLFGKYIGECVNEFIETNNIDRTSLIIGSHGHTVFHEPAQGFSTQIGCGATIAAITGCTTVTDLRSVDVALGGQGAPIIPIGEYYLWSDYNLFLNIGGIANLSLKVEDTNFIAYDICSANGVLNHLVFEKDLKYDKDGLIAKSGSLNEQLFNQLNQLDYYKQPYPKSLNNMFGTALKIEIIDNYTISLEDKLNTYTEHIAYQISNNINQLVETPSNLLVTGGGAYNTYLIYRIKYYLNKQIILSIPDTTTIEYKEAIVMAFIGVLRVLNKSNVLSSVTGAKRNSINGCIWNV